MVKIWKGEMVESLHESPPGFTPCHPCLPGSSTDRRRSVGMVKPVPSGAAFIKSPFFCKIKLDIYSTCMIFCYAGSGYPWGLAFIPFRCILETLGKSFFELRGRKPPRGRQMLKGDKMGLGYAASGSVFSPAPGSGRAPDVSKTANNHTNYRLTQSSFKYVFSPRHATGIQARSNIAHYLRQAAPGEATGKKLNLSSSKAIQGLLRSREVILPG